MTQNPSAAAGRPTRREISDAVGGIGWRYVLGALRTSVLVPSLARGADVAVRAAAAAGDRADGSLWMDVRRDRVVLTLQSLAAAGVTPEEIELAHLISAAVGGLGLRTGPEIAGSEVTGRESQPDGTTAAEIKETKETAETADQGLRPDAADPETAGRGSRSDQILEIAVDALDIAAIRPFWKAVMGYVDEAGASGPEDPLVDPVGQGPAIWFQQMDAPRLQRNRIHLDVSVPHDEAPHRIRAALAAGGVLVYDSEAPAFWVLADAEGNEACVTTWQGRD
ncbi:VOC family protein [Streptosporangium sp. NPDC048047]|uniref:VOC family protein n=1 Tax=Streptosporangium sp. NPDC048047 TaxID=3155748 RepID=UPI00343DCA49